MCVAIPGKVVTIHSGPGPSRPARVSFAEGEPRVVDLAMIPEAEVGDYVIVHSGFAISKVSQQSALESYRLFGL